ncbi:MAG: endonuclease III [Candidatus Korobacteraceae bacterium]
MPRGIMPRRPSRSGRQDKVAGAASRAKSPALAKRRLERGTQAPASQAPASKGPTTKTPAKVKSAAKTVRPATKPSGKPAKGYNPVAPERVNEILKRLDERYPNASCALHHSSAWELLVATILSAQCTDVRVNMVTPVLFQKYPTPEAFAALQPEDLEDDIRSTGFFRNKAKSLVGAARKILSDFGGEVPRNMEELLTIPGVARKTANVVLGTWYKIADGVVVDTHVQRISRRLELTKNTDPGKIEQDLMKVIPRARWILFSHQIIFHGRALCLARSPKCADCPLENICHAGDKTWSTVDVHKNARL